MSYRHTSGKNIRWATALPPAPRRQHPADWQPASAARRHELAHEEARQKRRYLQLAPGHIVVYDNAPWRVLAIDERPDDLWGEKHERQFANHLADWERHGRGDKPDRATWRGRPVMVQVVPVADPKAKPVHLRAPGSHQWPVLPEHYSVCAACGELPPCRHELAEQEADRVAARADVLMAIPPGNCLACGETITSRQKATRFPGPNLWRPDLGDNTARFHDRRDCTAGRGRYQRQWEAAGGTTGQTSLPLPGKETP